MKKFLVALSLSVGLSAFLVAPNAAFASPQEWPSWIGVVNMDAAVSTVPARTRTLEYVTPVIYKPSPVMQLKRPVTENPVAPNIPEYLRPLHYEKLQSGASSSSLPLSVVPERIIETGGKTVGWPDWIGRVW